MTHREKCVEYMFNKFNEFFFTFSKKFPYLTIFQSLNRQIGIKYIFSSPILEIRFPKNPYLMIWTLKNCQNYWNFLGKVKKNHSICWTCIQHIFLDRSFNIFYKIDWGRNVLIFFHYFHNCWEFEFLNTI